jgi:hypothetical protein
LLCVVGGREPVEGGVGPVGIVLGAPVADEDLGFEEAGELLDVEQLVAHPAAVRVDSGVLPGRARLDVAGTRACEAAPVPQGVRGELGAVVAAHEARMPASLGGGERRRPRGRHLAVRLAAAGECVVDVPPKLSARVRVLSSFAGNARKNDGLDALATALAASRNERLVAVDPEVGSETLRLLSERREDLVAERTRALKAACMGFCETSSPAA